MYRNKENSSANGDTLLSQGTEPVRGIHWQNISRALIWLIGCRCHLTENGSGDYGRYA